jgi:hypothetical protein
MPNIVHIRRSNSRAPLEMHAIRHSVALDPHNKTRQLIQIKQP